MTPFKWDFYRLIGLMVASGAGIVAMVVNDAPHPN